MEQAMRPFNASKLGFIRRGIMQSERTTVKSIGKPPKYRNRKVIASEGKFDSMKEYNRWLTLKLQEKTGYIKGLQRQVVYDLADSVMLHGRRKPKIRYIADFVYIKDGLLVVEDAKSAITRINPVFRIKLHLMMAVHGIEVKLT